MPRWYDVCIRTNSRHFYLAMSHDEEQLGNRGDYADLWRHHSVGHLISSTKDHIVHLDKDGDIDWETTVKYDSEACANSAFDVRRRNSIFSDAAILETTPSDGLSVQVRQSFKRLIGEALVRCLDFDYEGVQRMIAAARQFVKARSEETSRRWYLSASLGAASIFCTSGAIAWLNRSSLLPILGVEGLWLAFSTVTAAAGALLSVISRAGRIRFDSSAGLRLHVLEGCSRIIAGAISGLLAATAVDAGLFLSALAQNGHVHRLMMFAALIAGAGERLSTSIISKFDTAHGSLESEKAPIAERLETPG